MIRALHDYYNYNLKSKILTSVPRSKSHIVDVDQCVLSISRLRKHMLKLVFKMMNAGVPDVKNCQQVGTLTLANTNS